MAVDIVASRMPDFPVEQLRPSNPKRGYGVNGFNGSSSDVPGDIPTRSPLSVELFPNPQIKYSPQTRDVGKSNVPIAFGMRHR